MNPLQKKPGYVTAYYYQSEADMILNLNDFLKKKVTMFHFNNDWCRDWDFGFFKYFRMRILIS